MKAVELLRTTAKVTHAKSFRRFVQELENKLSGPFDEVNDMIQKMVFRLMAEQKDEDDHKNWCDVELSKAETSKDHHEDKIELLSDKIDEAQSTIDELTEEIADAE